MGQQNIEPPYKRPKLENYFDSATSKAAPAAEMINAAEIMQAQKHPNDLQDHEPSIALLQEESSSEAIEEESEEEEEPIGFATAQDSFYHEILKKASFDA